MRVPPCGLYRTLAKIGDVEAGRLVYLHDHGNPGPGLYFPESWSANRAKFSPRGMTLPPDFDAADLLPLPREGYYRVTAAFHCCAKKCVRFEPDALVQLGYNGAGRGIVFVPELSGPAITVGERGSIVDDAAFANLAPVNVKEAAPSGADLSLPRGIVIH